MRHETDPEESRFGEPAAGVARPGDEMGPRDGTMDDQTMDPEALDAPGRVAPDDTSAIPSDTQPVAEDAQARTLRPGQASDQSAAPIPDVMGGRDNVAPDPMGAPIAETDETLGDRTEADRR